MSLFDDDDDSEEYYYDAEDKFQQRVLLRRCGVG